MQAEASIPASYCKNWDVEIGMDVDISRSVKGRDQALGEDASGSPTLVSSIAPRAHPQIQPDCKSSEKNWVYGEHGQSFIPCQYILNDTL